MERGGMGVDEFLDATSLIGECSSGDYKMLDWGRGKCFQEVWGGGCFSRPITGKRLFAAQNLKLLDVW